MTSIRACSLVLLMSALVFVGEGCKVGDSNKLAKRPLSEGERIYAATYRPMKDAIPGFLCKLVLDDNGLCFFSSYELNSKKDLLRDCAWQVRGKTLNIDFNKGKVSYSIKNRQKGRDIILTLQSRKVPYRDPVFTKKLYLEYGLTLFRNYGTHDYIPHEEHREGR